MRNGVLLKTARWSALASLLGAPGLGWLHAAVAQPAPPGNVIGGGGPGHVDLRALMFVEAFWQHVWDVEFVLDQTGMTLAEGEGPGEWGVLVHDGRETVAEGHYDEHLRLAVPWLGTGSGDPDGIGGEDGEDQFGFDLYVTAGMIAGSTGLVTPMYGLARRVTIVVDGEDPITVEGLSPLGVADDLDDALAQAQETHALLSAGEYLPVDDGEPPWTPDDDDPCGCDEVYDAEIAACLSEALSCEAACAAAAIAAIVACLLLGPFAPACIAAALAAEALCMLACILRQRACNSRAWAKWIGCWLECITHE